MTQEEKINAINKVIDLCKTRQDAYTMTSLRSALTTLQYHPEDTQEVIEFVAESWDYCLDHTIPMTGSHEAASEKPDWRVCYWGPDQLASRLYCVPGVKQRWQ